tara:strand:+ start:3012 stop:3260 length:249 start_codon:yes stop_codon:yes gene_type:complete
MLNHFEDLLDNTPPPNTRNDIMELREKYYELYIEKEMKIVGTLDECNAKLSELKLTVEPYLLKSVEIYEVNIMEKRIEHELD